MSAQEYPGARTALRHKIYDVGSPARTSRLAVHCYLCTSHERTCAYGVVLDTYILISSLQAFQALNTRAPLDALRSLIFTPSSSPSPSLLMSLPAGLCLLFFLSQLAPFASAAQHTNLPRPDPFADPKNDPYNPLKYIASNTLTAIAFSLVLAVGITQTWFIKRYGAKWMMSMTIGAYFFALGLGTRFGLHAHPQSKGNYIVEYLFVVLSPCAFIAADYVLLGRIAKDLQADQHLLVSSRRITIVYVSSDISTFLIQAIGGSMSASANDPTMALAGSRVFLAGLAAQLLSFITFSIIYVVFLYRIHKYSPEIWTMDKDKVWYKSWLALAGALIISCIGILIRSGYRVVELSEGFQGPLTRSEPFFYGLDTLPLFIAIVVYLPFWPGRFIPRDSPTTLKPEEVTETKQAASTDSSTP